VMNSRRFTAQFLPCFNRKDSTPLVRHETYCGAGFRSRL